MSLDLFKDDVIKIPGQKDLSGTGAANYFDFVKQTMTKESKKLTIKRINANKRNTFSFFKIKNTTPKKTTRKYGILW